jgi:hypothetical protein
MPAAKRRGGQPDDRPAQEVLTDRSVSARAGNDSVSNADSKIGLPPGEQYACPVCDGILYINWKVGDWSQRLEPFWYCHSCAADGLDKYAYNAALRANGIHPFRLKNGDFSELGEPLGASRSEPESCHRGQP